MINEFLFWAVSCGVWGFYFCHVLTNAGEVFAWWPAVVRFVTTGSTKISAAKNGVIAGIWKVTYECEKCHAAWVGLGVFPLIFGLGRFPYWIAFIVLSSFFAFVLEKWLN